MMTVRIWHNPGYREVQGQLQNSEPVEIALKSLQLVAIATAVDLNAAWMLAQATDQQQGQQHLQIISPGRKTADGDVLQTDNTYYLIAIDQFMPLTPKLGTTYLIPVIFRKFQFDGLWELEQIFNHDGFLWRVVEVTEYDTQNIQSTVVACQGPPSN